MLITPKTTKKGGERRKKKNTEESDSQEHQANMKKFRIFPGLHIPFFSTDRFIKKLMLTIILPLGLAVFFVLFVCLKFRPTCSQSEQQIKEKVNQDGLKLMQSFRSFLALTGLKIQHIASKKVSIHYF